jgi:hypothetical protein
LQHKFVVGLQHLEDITSTRFTLRRIKAFALAEWGLERSQPLAHRFHFGANRFLKAANNPVDKGSYFH